MSAELCFFTQHYLSLAFYPIGITIPKTINTILTNASGIASGVSIVNYAHKCTDDGTGPLSPLDRRLWSREATQTP